MINFLLKNKKLLWGFLIVGILIIGAISLSLFLLHSSLFQNLSPIPSCPEIAFGENHNFLQFLRGPSYEKPRSPLKSQLCFLEKPLMGKPVTLIYKFKSSGWGRTDKGVVNTMKTTAQITLPEGIEIVRGNLMWQGDLEANEEQRMQVTVKITRPGTFRIKGWVLAKDEGLGSFGDLNLIEVELTSNNASIKSVK